VGESIADNYLLLGTPVTRGGHLENTRLRESSPFSFFLPPNLRIFDPGSAISAGALTLLDQLLAKLYRHQGPPYYLTAMSALQNAQKMSTVARAANGDKIAALQVAAQVAENTTAEERQQAMAIAQQTHGVVQGAVTEQQKKEGGMAARGGAALAAGVTGAVLAGPVIAVGAAAGGAYAATRNDGVGDAARKIGVGTTSAISAANQYNQEHHVTQRAYDGTKQALHAAAEFDNKHQVTATVGTAAAQTASAAAQFNKDHKVAERSAAAASTLASGAASAFRGASALNEKHQVTQKMSAGMSAGWSKFKSGVNKGAASAQPPK
jgi:hypothetical protein